MPGPRDRARADVAALVHRSLSVAEFSRAATRALRRAVPFDGSCVLTFDPATLLPTGELTENGLPPAAMQRLTEIELAEPDFNRFTTLAHARASSASLSAATEGRLDRSLRQRELRRPSGFDDELRAALVGDTGTWGAITLLRERGRPHFTAAEVRLVGALSGALAEGLRRAILLGAVGRQAGDTGSGLLVLAPDGSVELANAAAEGWLDELGAAETALPLPVAVQAVAARARRAAGGHDDRLARARVRARSGRWVLVHASLLGDRPGGRVAVILEAARPAELAPLIADAYGLTERERLVTQLVAQGLPTSEIGRRLHLSPWTVQDHLKAIFEKTGSASRGEVVARVFFDHYAPRLTDGVPLDGSGWFAATDPSS